MKVKPGLCKKAVKIISPSSEICNHGVSSNGF